MILQLHTQGLQTIQQIRAFVDGSQTADFEMTDRHEANCFIDHTRRFSYPRRRRAGRRLLSAYLMTVIGLLRAQITRRIRQHRDTGRVRDGLDAPAPPFTRRYTAAD